MNFNDLVFNVSKRAKELADKPINELRLAVGTADTLQGAIQETKHMSRGELIESILTEEFCQEFPVDIPTE